MARPRQSGEEASLPGAGAYARGGPTRRMDVAIVGAGAAGAGTAYALRNAPADVTVFEKSRGVRWRRT